MSSSDASSSQDDQAFRALLRGWSISMLGSRVSMIAFPMLVLYITKSPVYAGLAVFAVTAPSVLFYIPAGALVDHWDPRRTMLGSELLRGLLIGVIVITFAVHGSVRIIMVLAVLEEISEVFAALAQRRYTRILVDSDIEANVEADIDSYGEADAGSELAKSAPTRVEARSQIILLIGRPLGGLLFEFGAAAPFFLDIVTFIYSCWTLRKLGEQSPARPRKEPRLQLGAEIAGGFKCLVESKYLRASVMLNSWMTLISQALILIFIAESDNQHLSALTIGIVLACSGLGGALGAKLGKFVDGFITSNLKVLKGRSRVKIQLCVWSAGLFVLAVSMASWCMAIVMAVFGFAGAMGNIEVETYINKDAPKAMTARLASIDRLTSLLTCAAGPAIGGLLAGSYGTRAAVWGLFVLAVLPTAAMVIRARLRARGTLSSVPSHEAAVEKPSSPDTPAEKQRVAPGGTGFRLRLVGRGDTWLAPSRPCRDIITGRTQATSSMSPAAPRYTPHPVHEVTAR